MTIISSYDDIRTEIHSYNRTIRIIKRHNDGKIPASELNGLLQWERDIKEASRDFYRNYDRYNPDPLSVPIRNTKHIWRTVADRDSDGKICGDSCTDFIIIPDHGQTYEELDEYVEDHCPYYYRSSYDFPTGRMITYGTSFTRTRTGILIRHHRGIDW